MYKICNYSSGCRPIVFPLILLMQTSQARQQPTWMTALNQQVFPTLRMPTGQPSCLIQSVGLHISPDTSFFFLFTWTAFSSALASRALCNMACFGVSSVIVPASIFKMCAGFQEMWGYLWSSLSSASACWDSWRLSSMATCSSSLAVSTNRSYITYSVRKCLYLKYLYLRCLSILTKAE